MPSRRTHSEVGRGRERDRGRWLGVQAAGEIQSHTARETKKKGEKIRQRREEVGRGGGVRLPIKL